MNHWQCAGDVPTDPWRGQMTMPRQPSLEPTPQGPRLSQAPVKGIDKILVNWSSLGPQGGAITGAELERIGLWLPRRRPETVQLVHLRRQQTP